MSTKKWTLLVVIAAAFLSFFLFDLHHVFNLDYFKQQQSTITLFYQENALATALIFFFTYIIVTGLSLPGAAFMTLIAGAVFGLFWGTIIVSFASTIGASLAFLFSRFILRDTIQSRFGQYLTTINKGIEQEGVFYLFALRLVPYIPFFIINLVMGLTTMRTLTFAWVSQVGMLIGTIVYINAGTQLAQLNSIQDIVSPALIISFVLLGIFPLITKKLINIIRHQRIYSAYKKPKTFDRNIIVIGAGSAGLVSAYIAATVKAKVTLIEQHKMGGDCLNTGCVPSKAFIRSSKLHHQIQNADRYGLKPTQPEFEFSAIMQRVHRIIKDIEPHDSMERYRKLGVECIQGSARFTSPYSVEVNGQTLTTRNIIIASGAEPFVPPITGIEKIDYLTSDNIWDLTEQPKRLIVLGGGPIGCELAQTFARLGSQVIQIEMLPRILIREDVEVSKLATEKFTADGAKVLTQHKALRFEINDGEKILVCEDLRETNNPKEVRIVFDEILIAVGRKPRSSGFGLEELNIPLNKNGTIQVNQYLQTNFSNIYACGDVAGPYQFTHTAAHQAWYCAVNALFGGFKKFKVDYRVIPWATFTDPEVARVGLNEIEAQEQNIPYEVTRYDIDDLDRAIADSAAVGFVKVLTAPNKDKILGVTIVSEHAGDLIAEFVLAMKHNIGLNKILGTIHIYPTLAEANKYAAGNWKKAHAPLGLLRWVERFHRWKRGT